MVSSYLHTKHKLSINAKHKKCPVLYNKGDYEKVMEINTEIKKRVYATIGGRGVAALPFRIIPINKQK